jgi:uncharacterized protein YbaP (TraB family)
MRMLVRSGTAHTAAALFAVLLLTAGHPSAQSVQPRTTGPSVAPRTAQPPRQGAAQKGFIWKIERAGRSGWVVGSLHMLTPEAYPLPDSMTRAFADADTLMEEADPDELASPGFAAMVLGRALYPEGQTLQDHVSADTFRLVVERGTAAGMPVEMLRRMKPWMIATTLQALELQRGGFDPALGLDVHFHELAQQGAKRFVPLETGLEQLGYLENMGAGTEDAMVRENLESAQAEVNEVRKIAAAWRSGDAATLEQVMLGSMKDSPAIYQSLIVSRNRNWLPKIQTCLDTSRCFIVVGAGHLVGTDGLLAMLKSAGYVVTQQ